MRPKASQSSANGGGGGGGFAGNPPGPASTASGDILSADPSTLEVSNENGPLISVQLIYTRAKWRLVVCAESGRARARVCMCVLE